ncbi:MAG: hypothetical protein V4577_13710 [Bacteroidota bacterium]
MKLQIAVLDDYQQVASACADWHSLEQQADITFFHDHIADDAAVVERLKPFQVVCAMRERTPLTAAILNQLPNLKLIVSTGKRNASIDSKAAEQLGPEIYRLRGKRRAGTYLGLIDGYGPAYSARSRKFQVG